MLLVAPGRSTRQDTVCKFNAIQSRAVKRWDISPMQKVYGVRDHHGDTLSSSYGTKRLKIVCSSLARRRETHPPIKRHDAFTWDQDLDWIEVELLQFGDALHQGRDTEQ